MAENVWQNTWNAFDAAEPLTGLIDRNSIRISSGFPLNNGTHSSIELNIDEAELDFSALGNSQEIISSQEWDKLLNENGNTPPEQIPPSWVFSPIIPSLEGIPADINWLGEFCFNVSFEEQTKVPKSVAWTYSQIMDELFINMGKPCKFQFSTSSIPPPGSVIRAMAMFVRSDHINDHVTRCITHTQPDDLSNTEFFENREHFIRSTNTGAAYQTCHQTRRMSVAVPYSPPQAGTENFVEFYSFMCLSTCVGGPNRRPMQVVFTLEHNGRILGRRTIKIKVCAAPGRARTTEESKHEKPKTILTRQNSASSKAVKFEMDQMGPATKIRRLENENGPFYVKVHNQATQKMLQSVADALALVESVPSEEYPYVTQHTDGPSQVNGNLSQNSNSSSQLQNTDSSSQSQNTDSSQSQNDTTLNGSQASSSCRLKMRRIRVTAKINNVDDN